MHFAQILQGNIVDLSNVKFIHPWGILMVCLILIERSESQNRNLILPTDSSALLYLRRMHFNNILSELGYTEQAKTLEQIQIFEHGTLNVQEILHIQYSDEFNSILGKFIKMFQNFGLNEQDARLATGVVGELGNNVFDHNSFSWPTTIVGAIIAAQNYPKLKCIEIAIGDPGVGFMGSLIKAYPDLKSDTDAIKKGLAGNSGRIGEVRGNGLKLIQKWTIENFSGTVMIHSGDGLVIVDKASVRDNSPFRILGTLAQFVIHYK